MSDVRNWKVSSLRSWMPLLYLLSTGYCQIALYRHMPRQFNTITWGNTSIGQGNACWKSSGSWWSPSWGITNSISSRKYRWHHQQSYVRSWIPRRRNLHGATKREKLRGVSLMSCPAKLYHKVLDRSIQILDSHLLWAQNGFWKHYDNYIGTTR